MAMESASASAPGAVAMEIPVRGALPVVEEDEGYSAPPPGSEERLRYRRGGGRRRRGVPFNRGGYYMLIVIGEIGTEQQLDTAKAQIERGEWWTKVICGYLFGSCGSVCGFRMEHKSVNMTRREMFWRNIIVSIGRSVCCSIAPWDSTHFPHPLWTMAEKLQTQVVDAAGVFVLQQSCVFWHAAWQELWPDTTNQFMNQ